MRRPLVSKTGGAQGLAKKGGSRTSHHSSGLIRKNHHVEPLARVDERR